MFSRLFAESGLSLDRLRTLVEVGAAGSIVKAAGPDPVRQSQYSRQIKELEDFFQAGLVERHGKGVRLTGNGRELARISRFFLLGLSNFQRGCLAEGQSYRIGAEPTFTECFLVPALIGPGGMKESARYSVERAGTREVEQRLHELTLDFGVVTEGSLSRPLGSERVGSWGLRLWVPRKLAVSEPTIWARLRNGKLQVAWAEGELPRDGVKWFQDREPTLACESFLQARKALESEELATVLPEFMAPEQAKRFIGLELPEAERLEYWVAWNPRLLRLNPHATKRRDELVRALSQKVPS